MAEAFSNNPSRLIGCEVALILSLTIGANTLAQAAPPPGHPSAEQAIGILIPGKPDAKDLNQAGEVVSTQDANEFTYVEVKRPDAVEWIAVPLMELKPGSVIRYEEGIVMADFYSKLLKRTFPSVRFVGQIEVDTKH
jgi:hypothetical protein